MAMTAGVLLAVVQGRCAGGSIPLGSLPRRLAVLDPCALIVFGTLILIATPLVGIAAATIGLLGKRNREALVGILILAVIACSFILAYR